MRILLICVLLAGSTWLVTAQSDVLRTTTIFTSPDAVPREHPVDFQRMHIDVQFDTVQGVVKGRVEHTFRVLQQHVDSIHFDAVKISIKQAMLGGRPVRFRSTDTSVIVYCEPPLHWDTENTITFTYEASPRKGLYFVGWRDTTGSMQRQIWTQGQAVDNRHWVPMYDDANDKMITETSITFDSTYTVISNGDLERSVANSDGTRTWHYAMRKPHSTYLVMLAIGKYGVTKDTSASGVPMELYWYANRPETAEPTYRMSVEAMDFLEKRIGVPYPWGVYRQVPVADFIYGAMENTTATVFGDFYCTDARGWLDKSYVRTNVHELTHQWYGDLITGRSRASLWLQESFATFYPHLFSEAFEGADESQWSRRSMQNQALAAGARNRIPIVHPEAGGDRVYPKGACVLDMMRFCFGDSALHRVLKHYLENHAFSTVETNDLFQAFQDVLGLSPSWFFQQWLYQGGEPQFKITVSTGVSDDLKGASTSTIVSIDQVQHVDDLSGYFTTPVVVSVHYDDGSMDTVRANVSGPHTSISIPNRSGNIVAFVLFDPGSWILKKVTFPKDHASLMAQVRKAPYMIDRYDALIALGADSANANDLLDAIEYVMEHEQHAGIRSEAVRAATKLALRGVDHAWKTVDVGMKDKKVEVRKAAIESMSLIPKRLEEPAMTLLSDSSYNVVAAALVRLCASFPQQTDRILSQTKGLTSPDGVVEIARLEVAINQGNTLAYNSLASMCGPAFEFRTRGNAMRAVRRTGELTAESCRNMLDALWSPNDRLAGPAREVLGSFMEQTRWKVLLRSVLEGLHPTAEQMRSVEVWVK